MSGLGSLGRKCATSSTGVQRLRHELLRGRDDDGGRRGGLCMMHRRHAGEGTRVALRCELFSLHAATVKERMAGRLAG